MQEKIMISTNYKMLKNYKVSRYYEEISRNYKKTYKNYNMISRNYKNTSKNYNMIFKKYKMVRSYKASRNYKKISRNCRMCRNYKKMHKNLKNQGIIWDFQEYKASWSRKCIRNTGQYLYNSYITRKLQKNISKLQTNIKF